MIQDFKVKMRELMEERDVDLITTGRIETLMETLINYKQKWEQLKEDLSKIDVYLCFNEENRELKRKYIASTLKIMREIEEKK